MVTITKKQIEEYYEKEWKDIFSSKSIELLIEATDKAFQLGKVIPFKEKEPPRLQNLGQI